MSSALRSFPLATALRQSMQGYTLRYLQKDIMAGLVVSLIALPLAMALAIAVGLPPQHGIYTAIIAGIATALLGGSMVQVSGPTAAFVVIVAPIVAEHGLQGLIWCEIIAGILLLVLGTTGFGKYINYVPYPVTTGFTAGIAVVIATLSLNDFLGLGIKSFQGDYIEKLEVILSRLPYFNFNEAVIGIVTLGVIIVSGKVFRKIPAPVVGIAVGTCIAYLFHRYGIGEVGTIGNRFTYSTAAGTGHGIPSQMPHFYLPVMAPDNMLSIPSYAQLKLWYIPAMVIAILAALESLLSATVADSMAGTRHNPNAELNGIGIGNILSGMVAGIPATGAIARTATNVHSGAHSPLAAVFHSLFILLYVLLLAPVINYIPMASLGALLLVVAYRMSHIKQFIRTIKIAPKSDVMVLLTCFALTVFVDMVAGVSVGIVLASFLFMKHIAELTRIEINGLGPTPEVISSQLLPDNVMVYRIDGPLFFGTVEKAYDRYQFVHDHIHTLVIDMEHVPLIDMTGLVAMKSMLNTIAREGRVIILCGKKEITDKIMQKISGTPIVRTHISTATSVKEAIQHIGHL